MASSATFLRLKPSADANVVPAATGSIALPSSEDQSPKKVYQCFASVGWFTTGCSLYSPSVNFKTIYTFSARLHPSLALLVNHAIIHFSRECCVRCRLPEFSYVSILPARTRHMIFERNYVHDGLSAGEPRSCI